MVESLNKYVINDEDDIYVFMKLIDEVKPGSILDVGMILKRVGAISRQVKNICIPENVLLTGIDIMPELKVKVYERIYDRIFLIEDVKDILENEVFDLVSFIGIRDNLCKDGYKGLLESSIQHCRYLIIDYDNDFLKNYHDSGKIKILTIGESRYILMLSGSDSK